MAIFGTIVHSAYAFAFDAATPAVVAPVEVRNVRLVAGARCASPLRRGAMLRTMQGLSPPHVFGAPARRLSRAEYDRMVELGFFEGERVELIHGMVVGRAPIGSPHSEVVDRLTQRFAIALQGKARVRIQNPYVAWDESEPEPDVAIVPDRSYANAHPDEAFLLIEVAETSLSYDRDTKAPLYAASRVAEYWIVDLASKAIEVYTKPKDGRFTDVQCLGIGDVVRPSAFPEVAINVRELVE
jgi:Uma2 family endonuclease